MVQFVYPDPVQFPVVYKGTRKDLVNCPFFIWPDDIFPYCFYLLAYFFFTAIEEEEDIQKEIFQNIKLIDQTDRRLMNHELAEDNSRLFSLTII